MNAMSLACVAAVGTGLLLSSQPAGAVIKNYNHFSNPARACQLSIPTTDTKIRPKASGYRNEGTASQFVICGLDNLDFQSQSVFSFGIAFTSMDGMEHNVSCTGVVGASGYSPLQYSTAAIHVPASGTSQHQWNAVNFGGAAGAKINGSLVPSITCTLPPSVAITYLFEYSDLDIGA